MQLENCCPCCRERITFNEMFKLWSISSKTDDKRMHCPFCNKVIGNISDYERYGLLGALPLFAIPLFYQDSSTAYYMAGAILFYTIVLFYFLYRLVPLKCLDNNETNSTDVIEEKLDEKHKLLTVLIISILFFISIFAVFLPLFQG